MKNFRLDTIRNITQEPQELKRDSVVPVGSPASVLLLNIINCCQNLIVLTWSLFDQLATAFSSSPP